MRLIDEIIDDYRIKKYGNLAHILKISHKMQKNKRCSKATNVKD